MQRALVLGGMLGLVACSMVTSLDGYVGGRGVTTSAEAGAPDAGADGARVDGSTPPPPADGAAKDFCASFTKAPRFCADFHDGVVVGNDGSQDFDDQIQNNGAPAPILGTTEFATAAPAARFVLPGGTRSFLSRTFAGETPGSVTFGMAMRVETTQASLDLMEIRLGTATDFTASLYLTRSSDASMHITFWTALPDGGSDVSAWDLSRGMPAATWTHILWTVDAGGVLVVTVDGVVALQQQLPGIPVPTTGIAFLAGSTDASADATLDVDDVYADF